MSNNNIEQKFANIIIKTTVGNEKFVISGLDYLSGAFVDELVNIGGVINKKDFTITIPYKPDTSFLIDDICSFYWEQGKILTPAQRARCNDIVKKLEGDDIVFKKTEDGIAMYDINELLGTAPEIVISLREIGVRAKFIRNNRRIYIAI